MGRQKPTQEGALLRGTDRLQLSLPPEGRVSEASRAGPHLLLGPQGRWLPRQQPQCDPGSFAPASRAPGSEVS